MLPVFRHRAVHAIAGLSAATLLLAACSASDDGAAAGSSSEDDMASTAPHDASDEMSDSAMDAGDDDGGAAAVADDIPASILGVTATAPDGSTFSIADFTSGPVFVETFATWCSNCRRQLGDTNTAAGQVGDGATFLALSLETALDPASLAGYADENGFDNVVFGVLTDESLAALADQFGNSVLNAPSTPKFRLDADGLSELATGYESVEDIVSQLA